MAAVKRIISTKDLDYICDMMNWNYIICKKLNHYFDLVKDDKIKEQLKKLEIMHKEHFTYLLDILD